MIDRRLDWISRHDGKSLDFPVSTMLARRARPTFMWHGSPKEKIDQGREGACVGFAWTNSLLALPLRRALPKPANDFALNVYKSAQKIDQWEGENYSGTSVLAGAKVIKMGGYINEYRWAFSVDDILGALAFTGPVVLGIPWYDSMYRTSPDGLITVSGTKVGGHAILATGYGAHTFKINGQKTTIEVVRLRNSWGPSYGIKGDGYIRFDDLANLLKGGGEACIPIGK